jgi:hypothetical protein
MCSCKATFISLSYFEEHFGGGDVTIGYLCYPTLNTFVTTNCINELIASIEAVLLHCFPEKGKMVLSGKSFNIT